MIPFYASEDSIKKLEDYERYLSQISSPRIIIDVGSGPGYYYTSKTFPKKHEGTVLTALKTTRSYVICIEQDSTIELLKEETRDYPNRCQFIQNRIQNVDLAEYRNRNDVFWNFDLCCLCDYIGVKSAERTKEFWELLDVQHGMITFPMPFRAWKKFSLPKLERLLKVSIPREYNPSLWRDIIVTSFKARYPDKDVTLRLQALKFIRILLKEKQNMPTTRSNRLEGTQGLHTMKGCTNIFYPAETPLPKSGRRGSCAKLIEKSFEYFDNNSNVKVIYLHCQPAEYNNKSGGYSSGLSGALRKLNRNDEFKIATRIIERRLIPDVPIDQEVPEEFKTGITPESKMNIIAIERRIPNG